MPDCHVWFVCLVSMLNYNHNSADSDDQTLIHAASTATQRDSENTTVQVGCAVLLRYMRFDRVGWSHN